MRLTLASAAIPVLFLAGGLPAATPAADPCLSITPATVSGYRTLIDRALRTAKADARANGTNGVYAVAATNARDLLQRSYDRATQMVDFIQGNTPTSTSYAEASHVKGYLQSILKWLPDAAHWATISAAYHKSQEAARTFDGTTEAIAEGGRLMQEAGRCYIAPYLAGTARAG